jgi:hypothetical protein
MNQRILKKCLYPLPLLSPSHKAHKINGLSGGRRGDRRVTEEREGVIGVNEVIGVIAIRVADGGDSSL